jgi:hypothetical protein
VHRGVALRVQVPLQRLVREQRDQRDGILLLRESDSEAISPTCWRVRQTLGNFFRTTGSRWPLTAAWMEKYRQMHERATRHPFTVNVGVQLILQQTLFGSR